MTQDRSPDFEAHRAHLTRLAYRMLGSLAEAEDAVQDSYLRWHGADRADVDNPRAFLSRVTTRICLDRLRAARRQRELYAGQWLPEPVVEDPAASAEHSDREVTMALMLALERLSPLERAAFILHDVFEMGFDEVAAAIGRTESACRQLASRARSRVVAAKPRYPVERGEGARLAKAFFEAARSGDAAGLRAVLAEGAVMHSDGGGRKPAAAKAIRGAFKIGRFFENLARRDLMADPIWSRPASINGLPGMMSLERDGTLQTMAVELRDGRITAIFIMRNPDKLRHIEWLLPDDVARRVAR